MSICNITITLRNVLVLAVCCLLLFQACQKVPASGSDGDRKGALSKEAVIPGLILGFSQIGSESAWRNANTRSIQEAADKAGIQLLFDNANQKQENQIKALCSFIAYQVDVIAFVPIVASGTKLRSHSKIRLWEGLLL